MRFTLGLDPHAETLKHLMDLYLARSGPRQVITRSLTLDEARDICYEILASVVSKSMRWSRSDRDPWKSIDEAMGAIYPAWLQEDGTLSQEGTEVLETVIDETYCDLANIVADLLGEPNTWHVIRVLRHNHMLKNEIVGVTITLLDEGDFRILDWKRRMRSGQWRLEDQFLTESRDFNENTVSDGERPEDMERLNSYIAKEQTRMSPTGGISTLGKGKRTTH